ncbi:hypothetical protein BHUM_04564 [Candidatus Burkholderia humilis]|nr:hypothetical protein BHUM_04564 [Candidatus Burkholderia humilis]
MTASALKLDHLVIAACTLEEGAQFIASKFGVETVTGGQHPSTRTHNRLVNLWGGAYLEVIAIDPAAAPADSPRPRLFALDAPAMQRRLENDGPQLVHWVARVDRPKSLVRWREQYPERIAPVAPMTRAGNTWGLTVPDDGAFPAWQGAGDGVLPSLIQWDTPRHPADALPKTGIALKTLTGYHPNAQTIAEQLAWLGASHLMRVAETAGAPVLIAQFELPDGSAVTLGESAESMEKARRAQEEALAASKWRRAKSRSADEGAQEQQFALDADEAAPNEPDTTADTPDQ